MADDVSTVASGTGGNIVGGASGTTDAEKSTGRHANTANEPQLVDESGMRNQHPSLAGDVEGEIAKRSLDSDGRTFLKTFVMLGAFTNDVKHPQHEANFLGTLQEAINRGLHPKGEPRLVKVEVGEPDRRGAVTTRCTYGVEVIPAVVDTENSTTETPSTLAEKQSGS